MLLTSKFKYKSDGGQISHGCIPSIDCLYRIDHRYPEYCLLYAMAVHSIPTAIRRNSWPAAPHKQRWGPRERHVDGCGGHGRVQARAATGTLLTEGEVEGCEEGCVDTLGVSEVNGDG